jgi:hypothetical protein
MSNYDLALFVHIVGAIGAFIGVSVWLFAALALRRAQDVGQVRALTSLIQPRTGSLPSSVFCSSASPDSTWR